VSGALTRYRVMAWVVGVLLVTLVFIGMPLKYIGDTPEVVAVVGFSHGMLYMVYLATALDLAVRRRWHLPKVLLVFAAGLVPFLTFYVERRVVREERLALPR
jgi:integral membrane protein